jgi:ethanolamine utilization protein EutJ
MEKVASIVTRHILIYREQSGHTVDQLILVGGTSRFPDIARVVEEYSGLPTRVPQRPLFVTPLGIAMHDKVPES